MTSITRSPASSSAPTSTARTPCPNAGDGVAVNSAASGNFIGLAGQRGQRHLGQRGQRRQPHRLRHRSELRREQPHRDRRRRHDLTGQRPGWRAGRPARPPPTSSATRPPETSNVISGNKTWGVYISDSGTNGNTVANDFIGTNVAGTSAVPNTQQRPGYRLRGPEQHRRRDDGRRPQPDLGQPPRGRPDRLRRHGEQRGRGQLHRHRRHRQALPDAASSSSTASTSAWERAATPSAGRTPSAPQHRRLERHLGQRRQRHPGHRQRHDRHLDLRQLHRHRRHRHGRPAQRRQRRARSPPGPRARPSAPRRSGIREPQRHLGQSGRWRLDHVLAGQQSHFNYIGVDLNNQKSPAQQRQRRAPSTRSPAIA